MRLDIRQPSGSAHSAGAGLPAWISPDIIDLQGPMPLVSIMAAGADEVRHGGADDRAGEAGQ